MKTHICIPIDKALTLLENGKNMFNVPSHQAYLELIKRKEAGKQYMSGCDKEDSTGMCQGHP